MASGKTHLDTPISEGQTQEILLPVHGFVRLFPEEIILIDHPAYQRLRHMRQLGFAHYVFPGASHTRFEHSLGSLFVASKILEHLAENHRQDELRHRSGSDTFERSYTFTLAQCRFIRMAALCHDIGHLPFSHTLEDELGHLEKHDGSERPIEIARFNWGRFRPTTPNGEDLSTLANANFEDTVNGVYRPWLTQLFDGGVPSIDGIEISSFDIFCAITIKESDLIREGTAESRKIWIEKLRAIGTKLPITACRDMVGDTICADFLDYIHRDWYHVGKAIQVDDRLFQYMRVLKPIGGADTKDAYRFVIDVGPRVRLRHDAITLILDLLDSRYKLTETVLFHRTKLGIISLLDRILLEIRELWIAAKVEEPNGKTSELQRALKEQLMLHSDDHLSMILKWLCGGGGHEEAISRTVTNDIHRPSGLMDYDDRQHDLEDTSFPELTDITLADRDGAISEMKQEILSMIERLDHREIYTLADRIDVDAIGGTPTEGNRAVQAVIDIYTIPKNRYGLLRAIENTCGLARGSVLMYCPPKKKMGAKLAEVNLHIDGNIIMFKEYEKEAGETGLTCNALNAQVRRFYQLWCISIYVDRSVWRGMSDARKAMFRRLVRVLLNPRQDQSDATARETEARALIQGIKEPEIAKAARSDPGAPLSVLDFDLWKLPSGMDLPFDGK